MNATYVNIVEMGVYHAPEGLEGWRAYRIEYWKPGAPFAFREHLIWLPPDLNQTDLEDWINDCSM